MDEARHRTIPIALAAVAVVLIVVRLFTLGGLADPVMFGLLVAFAGALITTVLAFLVVLRFFTFDFGDWPTAILKASAIVLVQIAIELWVPGLFGGLLSLAAFWAMMMVLFAMDTWEAIIATGALLIARLLVILVLFTLLLGL